MPKIHLSFVPMGATVRPEPGKLFLDTGNRLCPGVLDHHQLSRETCTALLALQRKELYTEWLAERDEVEVVLHMQPDIDCIAALYIVDTVLNGKNISEGNLDKLVRYTLEKDRGLDEFPNMERPSLSEILTAHLQLVRDEFACADERSPEEQLSPGQCREMNERMAGGGLKIVSRFMELLEWGKIGDFRLEDETADEPLFSRERRYLEFDYTRYLSDLGDFNRVSFVQPRIPFHGLNISEEKTALVYRNPTSTLFKVWARHDSLHAGSEEGFTILLVIWSSRAPERKRYIFSTDPRGKHCLRFLGDVLNYHEGRKREILGKPQEGRNRPGYLLPDPWYDGRAHRYTIVDTPHDGTVLDEEEVISIFTHFITENIFLRVRVKENRVMIIFPLRIRSGAEHCSERISAAGFKPVPQEEHLLQTFTSSFIGLFFSHDTPIKLFYRRTGEQREICIPLGAKEELLPVFIEGNFLISYSNILLQAVQLRVEDERLQAIQELNRFLNSRDLTRELTSGEERQWGFLLSPTRDMGMDSELFMNRVFLFNSLLLENFHLFRERGIMEPVIHSFLSCEATSIPSRPLQNEIINYSDYYSIGMNSSRYLSFQNLYDPRLNRKNIMEIYHLDQMHYFYLYLFVILKKVVLRDLSERFSHLDIMHITRRTAKEYRELEADALNYVNTVNPRHISTDSIATQVCDRMHEVNTIAESFSEIFTSMRQLNEYNDARFQKRQGRQMELLQGIFLVGVVAAVVTLGAMPGARIVTRDTAGKLLGDSEVSAFSWSDLYFWAPLVVIVAFAVFMLFKLVFSVFRKD